MSMKRLCAAERFSCLTNRFRAAIFLPAIAAFLFAAMGSVQAQDAKLYAYDGIFEDAIFDVESAIVDRGLVIDYVSHVGDMLNRTKSDVGGSKEIFTKADVFLFCSAVLSREVMEADPNNIAHCPYGIFVTDDSGTVQIGYRTMPAGPMKKVEALLDEIARSAAGQ